MRRHRLLAAAMAGVVVAAGCGGEDSSPSSRSSNGEKPAAATSASPSSSLPSASGPVLSIGRTDLGELPYTVQAVEAGTTTTAAESPAPAGQTYAAVVVEVKGKLGDRPLPAPNLPLILQWSGCGSNGCFSAPMERPIRYFLRSEADSGEAAPADESQLLNPGTAYITTVIALVPQEISLKQIKMCTSDVTAQAKQCTPLAPLPSMTG